MKQFSILLIIGVVAAVVGGCALQKDLVSLESRQAHLEKRTLRMEKEVGSSIKSQIEDVIEGRQDDVKKMRSQYASIKAEVEGLRDEVNQLRGAIEEAQFKKTSNSAPAQQQSPQPSKNTPDLTNDLELIKHRLNQLEAYLDLDSTKMETEEAVSGEIGDDKALYADAKTQFDQGRMYEARNGFSKLIKDYPKSSNADNAQFWIGETYYQQKWYEKAILEYQKVIDNYPKENKVPAAMLKQAFAFLKIGDKPNAKLVLKELTEKFSDSNEAKIAEQKLKEI